MTQNPRFSHHTANSGHPHEIDEQHIGAAGADILALVKRHASAHGLCEECFSESLLLALVATTVGAHSNPRGMCDKIREAFGKGVEVADNAAASTLYKRLFALCGKLPVNGRLVVDCDDGQIIFERCVDRYRPPVDTVTIRPLKENDMGDEMITFFLNHTNRRATAISCLGDYLAFSPSWANELLDLALAANGGAE